MANKWKEFFKKPSRPVVIEPLSPLYQEIHEAVVKMDEATQRLTETVDLFAETRKDLDFMIVRMRKQ